MVSPIIKHDKGHKIISENMYQQMFDSPNNHSGLNSNQSGSQIRPRKEINKTIIKPTEIQDQNSINF